MNSLLAIGDSAVKISFNDKVSPKLNREIQLFCNKLRGASIDGVVEWVPAFDSITIYYKPSRLSYQELCSKLREVDRIEIDYTKNETRIISVPVVYGGEYGPDLERVATTNRLSEEEVISVHCENEYLVYMLGFLPGFPYLGGLDKRIATPRLEEPRAKTIAGAVGIAHEQTGIYPIESPGGWNIIGKTPLKLFNMLDQDAFLFHAGDKVKFYEVTEDEFKKIENQVENGDFHLQTEGVYDG